MQDVLVTLLNNLKVQERQNRVCTTVAIAIVAETCSPFTVLPALMNEYKVSFFTRQSWPSGPWPLPNAHIRAPSAELRIHLSPFQLCSWLWVESLQPMCCVPCRCRS